MSVTRPRLLLIGAVPPPQHGVTGMNALLLQALDQTGEFAVRHLDLSDRRPISTVEKFDWQNVFAALQHGLLGLWSMLYWRPALVYLPISQKTLGFLRDAQFLIAARLTGAAVVVHLHGGNFHQFYAESRPAARALIRYCLRRVAAAIVLGENLRHCLTGVVPPERVVVVPNGIVDLTGPPTTPPEPVLRVLYLGTVVTEKGIAVFLEAAQRVLTQTCQVQFLVAGPWYRKTERDRFTSLASKQIVFLGEVRATAKVEALRQANVLVFPSTQQEGLPLTVLEGMCAGLAVIASDRGCLREVVVDGETGFVIPPNDSPALAEKILAFSQDRALCAAFGRAGRQRYEQAFTERVFVARMMGLLSAVARTSAAHKTS